MPRAVVPKRVPIPSLTARKALPVLSSEVAAAREADLGVTAVPELRDRVVPEGRVRSAVRPLFGERLVERGAEFRADMAPTVVAHATLFTSATPDT